MLTETIALARSAVIGEEDDMIVRVRRNYRDHLVAFAYAEREQGQPQCVGAAADPYRVLAPAKGGEGFLESRYKGAPSKRRRIQDLLDRRMDLIPNLVETVKGFATQEKTVLTDVVEARAKATQTQVALPPDILNDPAALQKFQDAQGQLGNALGRLIAITENYPELKSNQNFLALQSQLEGTENRIAVARRDYIEAVRVYNTELATFPGRLWASFLYSDKKPMATFAVEEDKTKTPEVKFN